MSAAFYPYAEMKALVGDFEAAGLDYALCGGLALAIHGAPRATQDIDVLARPGDIEAIEAIARARGFVFGALPMTFADGIVLRRFTKLVGARPLMLDVMLIPASVEPLFEARLKIPWEGGILQVVTRDGLVVLKTTAGRPQDLVDIQRLMELDRDGR